MSAKTQTILSTGIVFMLVFAIGVGGYYIQETKNQSAQNGADVAVLNQTLNQFIDKWDKRVSVSNKVNNVTQQGIFNILNSTDFLTGEKYGQLADQRTDRIISNLSAEHKEILDLLKSQFDTSGSIAQIVP